jgi:hypothetical protein
VSWRDRNDCGDKGSAEMTITQEPDLPDLVRMIVDRMRSNGIDYEDGGVILLDLYAEIYDDVDVCRIVH